MIAVYLEIVLSSFENISITKSEGRCITFLFKYLLGMSMAL